MDLSFFEYLLIGTSITLLCICIIVYIIWKYRRKPFTRERFAFLGFTLLISFSIFIVPYMFGSNLFFEFLNLIVKLVSDSSIDNHEPGTSDKILAFLLLIFLGFIYLRIFKNWNGQKSIHQAELNKSRKTTTIFKDIKIYFNNDEKLKLYIPELHDKSEYIINEPQIESIAWYQQVQELLTLSSSQYKLNLNQDWYQKEKCFISCYGKENQPLAVFCAIDMPSNKKIIDFISFSLRQFSNKNKIPDAKFIVAIKNLDSEYSEKEIKTYKVKIINEAYLLNELIDFSSYKRHLAEQFEDKEIINGYNLTLKDVYTQPTCEIKDEEKYKDIDNIEKYIVDWINETKDKKHLAILGEYGQGKSVLSQRISYLITQNNDLTDRIPIIIELRGRYPKQYTNSLALLSDWCSNFSINPKALLKLHLAGKLLIIFEGFDEMELIGDYEIRVDHFRKLWEFSTPKSKIIITGRPNFFLNNNELQTLLKTSKEYLGLSYCEELYLKRFTKGQISDALRNSIESTKKDILEILNTQDENDSFFDLMSRPSSLFLASIVWNDREISKYKENINSALVIEEFLNHSYSRQENKNSKAALSIHERAYFMKGIAVGMAKKDRYTNQISQNNLKEIILKLYNNFPEKITEKGINNKQYTKSLSKRFDKRYNLETVLLDIRSCGILVRDLSTFDSFKFAHKSFLELLVSDFITKALIKSNKEIDSISEIINNSINDILNCDPNLLTKTPDVLKFISENSVRLLQLNDQTQNENKIEVVFKSIYSYKFLDFKKTFKLISYSNFFSIKLGLIFISLKIVFFCYFSYLLYMNIIPFFQEELNTYKIKNAMYIVISLFFIMISLKKRSSRLETLIVSISDTENIKNYFLIDHNSPLDRLDVRTKYDTCNLILFFMICKDLRLLDTLKTMIPKRTFLQLELLEKYLNRYKSGQNLNDENFISLSEKYEL